MISQRSGVPRLNERDPPILFVENNLIPHVMREILVGKIVYLDTNFFISIMFEHGFSKIRISQETIVDPFEMLLDAFLFHIVDYDILSFLEFSHFCGHEIVLLNHVVWN